MTAARFLAGRDLVSIEGGNGLVAPLARRLWDEAPPDRGGASTVRAEVRIRVEVTTGPVDADPERESRWTLGAEELRLDAPGILLRVRPVEGVAEARVARALLEGQPRVAARLLLETPVTLAKMTWMQLLHAGALVGPGGAVVVRGPAGAGKSTLVAAGWKAGLGVLGDESLLVDRDDPDSLESTLRDLALSPFSASLLGIEERTLPAFTGGEEKRRVPLFSSSGPSDRSARRVATLLLGPREPGPARLVPLGREELLALFEEGAIPQERAFGADPAPVARTWAAARSFRLDGAVDLDGAVEIVTELTNRPDGRTFFYTPSQQKI